jgi:quinol monooxygenase YgiN
MRKEAQMADEKVTLIAKVKAKEGSQDTLKNELSALVEPTRKESGCITYNLHQSSDDSSVFMFYENWTSKQALDQHLRTPHLKAFLAKADTLLDGPLDLTNWKMVD